MSERFQKTRPSFLEAGLRALRFRLNVKPRTMLVSVLPRTGCISGGLDAHRQFAVSHYCQVFYHMIPILARIVPLCPTLRWKKKILLLSPGKNENISNFIGVSCRGFYRLTCLRSTANCS